MFPFVFALFLSCLSAAMEVLPVRSRKIIAGGKITEIY